MATKPPSPTTDPTSPLPTQQPLRQRRLRRPPASARGSTPTAPSSSAMNPTTKPLRSKALSTDLDQQAGGQEPSGSVSPSAGKCNSTTSRNLEYPANEMNNDLILQPRYHGVKRPEVVSFSEFLRIVASERQPRHRQPIGPLLQDGRNSNKADNVNSEEFPVTTDTATVSGFQYDSDSVKSPSVCSLEIPSPSVEELKGDVLVKSSPEKVDAEKSHAVNCTPVAALMHGIIIWEGTIKLSMSSLTNVVAIFKSGEKPSTNEWPRFLEIKQTMSLGVFEYLLERLCKSRKYTISTIESYTADDGVGLVNPTKEVDLFLCPCQGKAARILSEHHLLKEHSGSLTTLLGISIIGVMVWRRPRMLSRVPRQAATCSSLPMVSKPSSRSSNRPYHENADVPPGFGSGAIWDGNDDLPQYRLVSASKSAAYSYRSHQHVVHTCVPTEVDRARKLVHRYGGYNIPAESDTYSQGNPPYARYPYQHHQQQLQYHPMLPYHMSQSTLPQASTQHHQHIAMPVTQAYRQQSHLGVLDDGSMQHYGSDVGNQAWWYRW